MPTIAAATKVFTRADKLRDLLRSLEQTPVDQVYVADDGKDTAEKNDIYDAKYDFSLVVLNLEYDAGLGYGRKRIVEKSSEDFLLIVDTDHIVPDKVNILFDQLEKIPDVGGIAGNLIEPKHGRVYQNAHDIHEANGTLIRDTNPRGKDIELVAGHPFVEFDFIPNAAAFRRDCVQDYCWDPNYVIEKEHLDFYVGHSRRTDWRFGICPTVNFMHYPGGDQEYMTNRTSEEKHSKSTQYFLEKWGYSSIETRHNYWFDTHSEPTIEQKLSRIYNEKSNTEIAQESLQKLSRRILRLLRAQ